jgi:hypothetical protein
MKKFVFLFACMTMALFAMAQSETPMIIVEEAGTLESIITGTAAEQAEQLVVAGELNGSDIKTLRHLLGGVYRDTSEPREGNLRRLDITNATIVEGGEPYLYLSEFSTPEEVCIYTKNNTIGDFMFWDCVNLEEIRLPVNITEVNTEPFMYSTALKSVTIPFGITKLLGWDFGHCTKLKSISLPSTITELGEFLVDYSPSLLTFSCAATEPPSCEEKTFSDVGGVTLYVPVGCAEKYRNSLGWNKFGTITEIDPMDIHVEKPGTLDSLVNVLPLLETEKMKISGKLNGSDIRTVRYLLGGCYSSALDIQRWGKLKELDLSDASIVSGGDGYVLEDWLSFPIEEAVLYTGDDVVGSMMFFDCLNLKDIKLPANISAIGTEAFSNCKALSSINVPEGVSVLDEGVFYGCRALEAVCLPSTVTKLGKYMVEDCTSLKKFVCAAVTPPECNEQTFGNMEGMTLYVPVGCSDTYRGSVGWNKFGSIVETDTLLSIGSVNTVPTRCTVTIHDLQGRQLRHAPAKGVYIQDGKKRVVK